jgi:hypothetical protein
METRKTFDKRVFDIATKFTKKTLGSENPKGLCFTICYPLHLHLNLNGFKNSMKAGVVDYNLSHFWISLDTENTMIDPTARQFDSSKPYVFVGSLPSNYSAYMQPFEPIFQDAYDTWIEAIDKRILNICHKAAKILSNDIKKRPFEKEISADELTKYFGHIGYSDKN